jgi:hypothetical protein
MAAQFNELLRRMRLDIADVVRTHQGAGDLPADVPADAVATVLMAIVPGYILQLALLGLDAVDGAIDAVRALWPSPERAEV